MSIEALGARVLSAITQSELSGALPPLSKSLDSYVQSGQKWFPDFRSIKFPLGLPKTPQATPDGTVSTTVSPTYNPAVTKSTSFDSEKFIHRGTFTGQMVVVDPKKAIRILTMQDIGNYIKLIPGVMKDRVTLNADGSISYFVQNNGLVDTVIGYRVKFSVVEKPEGGFTVNWATAGLPQPSVKPDWVGPLTVYTYFKDNHGSWDFTPVVKDSSLYNVKFTTYSDTEFCSTWTEGAARKIDIQKITDKEITTTFQVAQRIFSS